MVQSACLFLNSRYKKIIDSASQCYPILNYSFLILNSLNLAMRFTVHLLSLLFALAFVQSACRKESFITSADARLRITADTLHYDTLFTTTGSVTQQFKLINENNQKLRISSVKLMGGVTSFFKINVDGIPGPQVADIELDANDSMYVFATVTINPNSNNLPFVVRDSIQVSYNGNNRLVQLDAWGQNARFLRNYKVTGTETWDNTLPYVILGSLQVDTPATLIMQQGTRVYLHADAPFIVDGTLLTNGSPARGDTTRVSFQGDRLDKDYRDLPGSWPGIYFRGQSKNSVLSQTIVRNAYQGIVAEKPSVNASPKVVLNECIIDNIYDAGILGVETNIRARNCLVSNCGNNVLLVRGGIYDFNHCTVASYGNLYLQHKNPVCVIANFIRQNNVPLSAPLTANFRNCIFWGDNGIVENEIVVLKEGNTSFNVSLDYNLWKVKDAPSNATISNAIANEAPGFDSIDVVKRFFLFSLKPGSAAIDKGAAPSASIDLNGKPRPAPPANKPDLGCYERQ
jgi:hypothetical protein